MRRKPFFTLTQADTSPTAELSAPRLGGEYQSEARHPDQLRCGLGNLAAPLGIAGATVNDSVRLLPVLIVASNGFHKSIQGKHRISLSMEAGDRGRQGARASG